jgi:2-oxoglutarate dehydrogenase complex dehydrogenase (E1) component-like enzyme
MKRSYRKPMVVVGPKTLLRHPQAVSDLAEMAPGTSFQPVIADTTVSPAQYVTGDHAVSLVCRANR